MKPKLTDTHSIKPRTIIAICIFSLLAIFGLVFYPVLTTFIEYGWLKLCLLGIAVAFAILIFAYAFYAFRKSPLYKEDEFPGKTTATIAGASILFSFLLYMMLSGLAAYSNALIARGKKDVCLDVVRVVRPMPRNKSRFQVIYWKSYDSRQKPIRSLRFSPRNLSADDVQAGEKIIITSRAGPFGYTVQPQSVVVLSNTIICDRPE